MTRVLFDTNIYSLAMCGSQEVVEVLRHVRQIGISAINLGELFSGFRGNSRERQNRQELFRFRDSRRVSIYFR